jgi:hypothetical protein
MLYGLGRGGFAPTPGGQRHGPNEREEPPPAQRSIVVPIAHTRIIGPEVSLVIIAHALRRATWTKLRP